MNDKEYLSIGDVLTLLKEDFEDVTISKIRFLESQGLLDPERTPSGYRKFYQEDVERLRWILRQQREHFLPLKVIKDRLDDTDERAPSPPPPAGPRSSTPSGRPPGPAVPRVQEWAPASSTVAPDAAASDTESARATSGHSPAKGDDHWPAPLAHDEGPPSWVAADQPPASGGQRWASEPASGRPPGAVPAGTVPAGGAPARGPATPGEHIPAAPSAGSPTAVPEGPSGVAQPARPAAQPSPQAHVSPAPVPPAQTVPPQAPPAEDPPALAGSGRSDGHPEHPQRPTTPAAGQGAAEAAHSGPDRSEPARPAALVSGPAQDSPRGAGTDRASVPPPGDLTGVDFNLEELAEAAGLSSDQVAQLEQYGLLSGKSLAGTVYYDEDSLTVARLVAGFSAFGVEARHLRMYKLAAEREAGFFQQIILPLLKQRNPQARQRANQMLVELSHLGHALRAVMLRTALRDQG